MWRRTGGNHRDTGKSMIRSTAGARRRIRVARDSIGVPTWSLQCMKGLARSPSKDRTSLLFIPRTG